MTAITKVVKQADLTSPLFVVAVKAWEAMFIAIRQATKTSLATKSLVTQVKQVMAMLLKQL